MAGRDGGVNPALHLGDIAGEHIGIVGSRDAESGNQGISPKSEKAREEGTQDGFQQ